MSVAPGIDAAIRAGPQDVPERAVTVRSPARDTSPGVTFTSRTGMSDTGSPVASLTLTPIVNEPPCLRVRPCGKAVIVHPDPLGHGPR